MSAYGVAMISRGVWIVLPAILLAACGGADDPGAEPVPPSLSPTPSAVPTPSTTVTVTPDQSDGTSPTRPSATCKEFGTTSDASSDDPQTMTTMTGKSMRVGRHNCFERFVFELQGEGERPGWTVGYRDPLAGQASGERIPLKGTADLEVIVQAWTVNDFEGRPPEWPPFTGPDDIVTEGFVAIKEARNLYAYEGSTQLGLGIDRKRPFQVVWFPDPMRLIVDVYTGVPVE